VSGRHTGGTDIPLSPRGEEQARHLRVRLGRVDFDQIVVSPLLRARQTAALAGLEERSEVDPDLREYDYGDFEGWTRDQIEASWPGWDLWRDGCPGGESPHEVLNRARRLLAEVGPSASKDVALFGHGHILRAVAAAYLGQEISLCRHLVVPVASISILGQEHSVPAIVSWGTA
jgi:broad specificity phosphatase PhoE